MRVADRLRRLALQAAALVAAVFISTPLLPALATDLISPEPKLRFVDSNGVALSGGKLFTYTAGSTTKTPTYTDSTGGTPNANPIILDTRGEANVWLVPGQVYKYTLSPSTDSDPPTNPIWTVDQLQAAVGLSAIGNNQVLCNTSGGSAIPVGCSMATLTSILNTCTATLQGLVPAPPNNTTTFLRGDCTFAAVSLVRRELSANTNYYVNSATGFDTNDCLSAISPCFSIQHAWSLVSSLDLLGYIATINIADGAYGSLAAAGGVPGATSGTGSIVFLGNTTTPASVTMTGLNAIAVTNGANVTVKGVQVNGTGLPANAQGYGIVASGGANVTFDRVTFGICGNAQIGAQQGSSVSTLISGGTYNITGTGKYHASVSQSGGFIYLGGATVTITGTPAYSGSFAQATQVSAISAAGMTFVGGATGQRFIASLNGVIDTGTGAGNVDNSYFPGNSAGAVSTGAQYN